VTRWRLKFSLPIETEILDDDARVEPFTFNVGTDDRARGRKKEDNHQSKEMSTRRAMTVRSAGFKSRPLS
jgi:hypothetical protein